jgi:hypothetical protein
MGPRKNWFEKPSWLAEPSVGLRHVKLSKGVVCCWPRGVRDNGDLLCVDFAFACEHRPTNQPSSYIPYTDYESRDWNFPRRPIFSARESNLREGSLNCEREYYYLDLNAAKAATFISASVTQCKILTSNRLAPPLRCSSSVSLCDVDGVFMFFESEESLRRKFARFCCRFGPNFVR